MEEGMEAGRLLHLHWRRVEVGGGNRWRRKAAFALENTGLVKLTGLRTCQMGRVREVSG